MSDNERKSTRNLYLNMKVKHHLTVPMLLTDQECHELQLPMVIMSAAEEAKVQELAENDARASYKTVPKTDEPNNYEEIYKNHYAYWTIFFATRLPNDLNTKFWESKQEVMDNYSVHEAIIVSDNYGDVVATQPHYKWLNEFEPGEKKPEFEDLIKEIINSGMSMKGSFFLNFYTTQSLKRLILYLVAKLLTLQKLNGTSGSP